MVYFIQDTVNKFIKIGKTSGSLDDRLSTIQTGNPNRLVVLNVIEDEDDRAYHEKFQHCWHRGEWFTPSADLLEFIQSLDTFTGWVTRKSLRDKMRLYEAICR